MNNWNERVLRSDPYMSPLARRLVDLISRYFSTTALNRCRFYDHEASALLGVSGAELREAKQELLRKGFLSELPSHGRKPSYNLRYGQPHVFGNGHEAARQ